MTGLTPRKQRTRQHVIADLSVNYVERIVIKAGHTVQRVEHDYGYDFYLLTYDDQGYVEPGLVHLQLKAMEALRLSGSDYVFDVDVRDYRLSTLERLPVVLILFDASRRKAYWLHIQEYFRQSQHRPQAGAKRIRVRISRKQILNRRAVAKLRELKQPVSLRFPVHIDD